MSARRLEAERVKLRQEIEVYRSLAAAVAGWRSAQLRQTWDDDRGTEAEHRHRSAVVDEVGSEWVRRALESKRELDETLAGLSPFPEVLAP